MNRPRLPGALAFAASLLALPGIAAAQCSSAPPYVPADAGPAPTAPSAPAPTGPAPTGPGPTGPGPSTPTPRTPRGPNTPGRGRSNTPRGGIVIPMTRQSTAKSILAVEWDCPVATRFTADSNQTRASEHYAWPAAKAFAKIAGDDPRPLLVLRECNACRGTEHAVFSRRLNNERTQLLLNWFHCVKLPEQVQAKNHPFHNVFAHPSGYRAHLFLSTADGKNKILFTGAQPQSLMQRGLEKTIAIAYKKKPKAALKAMLRYLSELDMHDLRESELLRMMDAAREKSGPKSSAVRKLKAKLAKVQKKKANALRAAKAVCNLKLKVTKVATKRGRKPSEKKGD